MVDEIVKKFKETKGTKRLLYEAEQDPGFIAMRIFDDYPTYEVRKGILGIWLERVRPIYPWQADWIETRIQDLRKEERETQHRFWPDCFWKDLLGWYVFNATLQCVTRALEFAINITQQERFKEEFGYFYRSDILKIITGKIHQSPEIYSEAPALKTFLGSFLEKGETYCDFTDPKRAVRCAVDVSDTSFLPQIEEIIHRLYNKRRNPDDFRERIEVAENLAFFRESKCFLEEALKTAK